MDIKHNRIETNGVWLHYITAGSGPIVLCLHGWPETHREYLPIVERLGHRYRFIAPDLRGFADSEKPFSGYEPKTIAADMLGLLGVEKAERFHILSHDLGGPPAVALAYMATGRALSLSTIETPFFGLDYPGYVDPRVAYWHIGMHMNMDITRFLVEGREEQYLRHFFRDFAYNPTAVPESEIQAYAMQMLQPGNLRASLNLYGYIPLWLHSANGRADEGIGCEEADGADDGVGRPIVLRISLHRQREGHCDKGARRCH
jgi:pimeloyl-ACP methyl ester carboxylesterase